MSDWATVGARHDIDDEGHHWHTPDYPSCVVCRMRDLERELTLEKQRGDEARAAFRVASKNFDSAVEHYGLEKQRGEALRAEIERLERIAELVCTAYNHPSGEYGQDEADEAADLACSFLEAREALRISQGEGEGRGWDIQEKSPTANPARTTAHKTSGSRRISQGDSNSK